jgi:ubiquinone/menaquinone biosynthesis C-methylase UbiE
VQDPGTNSFKNSLTKKEYFEMIKSIELPLPPPDLQKLVGSNTSECFLKQAHDFTNLFKKKKLIQKNYKILEPGCGCARIARALTNELDAGSGGEFHGFDVHKPSIDWASEQITKLYPNFHFIHTDVYNHFYNPDGKIIDVSDIFLPYNDNYFDFIYTTSFFTHLTREHLEYYLRAIYNFCNKGASVFSTFFCFDNIADFEQISGQKLAPKKYEKVDNYSYIYSNENPALVVTYHIDYLKNFIENTGFKILQSSTGWQSGWIFQKA